MFRSVIAVLIYAFALAAVAAVAANGCDSKDRPVSTTGEPSARSRPASGVTGRVTAPDGTPVAGALVRARSLDRPARAVPEIAILTDSSGVYVWPLRPGRYEIGVTVSGRGAATGEVTVSGSQPATLDLVLAP